MLERQGKRGRNYGGWVLDVCVMMVKMEMDSRHVTRRGDDRTEAAAAAVRYGAPERQ